MAQTAINSERTGVRVKEGGSWQPRVLSHLKQTFEKMGVRTEIFDEWVVAPEHAPGPAASPASSTGAQTAPLAIVVAPTTTAVGAAASPAPATAAIVMRSCAPNRVVPYGIMSVAIINLVASGLVIRAGHGLYCARVIAVTRRMRLHCVAAPSKYEHDCE